MPAPFPGMDPYMEGPNWTSFHAHFAAEIARQLTPRLRPNYVALLEKRYDVVDDLLAVETIYPDVGRAERRPMVEVWPIGLDHPLPTIPIPLLAGDADVPLELQTAFETVYDAGGFDLALDYLTPLAGPIAEDQLRWLKSCLQRSTKLPSEHSEGQ